MKKLLLLLLSITYLIAITPQEAILQTDIKYINANISEIKKDIKTLDNDLTDQKLIKKDVDTNLDNINKRLDDYNKYMTWSNMALTFMSIFVAIMIFGFGWNYKSIVKSQSKKFLYEMKEEIEKEIKTKYKEEFEKQKKELEKEYKALLNSTKCNLEKVEEEHFIQLNDMLNATQEQKDKVAQEAKEIDEKKRLTDKELFTKHLDSYYKGEYDKSIEYADMIIENSSDEVRVANSMYNKGLVLWTQNRVEEENKVYEEIEKIYSDSKNIKIRIRVAKSMVNRLEIFIINEKEYKDTIKTIKEKYSDDIQVQMNVSMLEIFAKAKGSDVVDDIREWQKKYSDQKLIWNFDDLKEWSGTLSDSAKERVESAIDEFSKFL
jgi:tetratricopeptide (TPR) repeat protein